MKQYIYLSIVLITLTGCAVHKPQQVELPFSTPEVSTSEMAPLADPWWIPFDDPELNRLIDYALTHNFSLSAAVARIEQLEAQYRLASSSRMPTIMGSGQIMHDESPGVIADSETDQTKGALTARWELDLWNKLKYRQQSALLGKGAAEEGLKGAMLSLSAQLATTYFQLITIEQQLELAKAMVEERQKAITFSRYRYERGTGTASSLYQAEELLAASQGQIPTLQSNQAKLYRALSILTGGMPIDEIKPAATLPTLDSFPIASVPSTLLADRPDIAAAHLELQAADANIGAAIANRFPSLQLSAGLGFSRTETLAGVASGNFWNLIASLSQPLFDGGARKSEIKRSEAKYRELLQGYYQTVLTAFREVENGLDQNRYDEERFSAKVREVAAATRVNTLAHQRYQQGLITYPELIGAELALIGSERDEISFLLELVENRITLARSLGGSWLRTPAETIESTDLQDETLAMIQVSMNSPIETINHIDRNAQSEEP